MKRVIVALAVAGLLGGGSWTVSAASPESEISGTWVAVSAEREGKADGELNGNRLTFTGNTFVIERDGKMIYKGTFKTDSMQKPARIDFRHTAGGAKGKKWRGIYALDGDSLQIADNAPDMTKPRPTELAAKAGSGHIKINFRRAAPR